MATMPYFGEQPGVGANFPSTQHVIFETEFRRRLRDLSVIDKITSKTWKGRFRNAGAQIRIPRLPLVQTNKRKPGDPVAYQDLNGSEEVFTINRERDVAFHVEVEDNIFSPMNLESAVNKEARYCGSEYLTRASLGMGIEPTSPFDMIKLVNPPLLLSPPCG